MLIGFMVSCQLHILVNGGLLCYIVVGTVSVFKVYHRVHPSLLLEADLFNAAQFANIRWIFDEYSMDSAR